MATTEIITSNEELKQLVKGGQESILLAAFLNKIEKLAEDFADKHERRGCAYWNGLYRGYIAGIRHFISSKQDVKKAVCPRCKGEHTQINNNGYCSLWCERLK